jgi:DNA-binding NarL/FixJ family response regulator
MNVFILADNQDITSEGLISLLQKLYGNGNVVTVGSCRELQEQLKIFPEAVVVLDYTLFDFNSVHQFINTKTGAQKSSWLLFSDELGELFLRQVLLSDPTISIVMKHDSAKQITEALQTVSTGGVYLCETAASILDGEVPKPTVPDILTATEKMILREIASGKMTKEIAFEKNVSFHTVNTHRKNIFRKLEINNVHEATKYALRAGLIDLSEYSI